jgi:quercetin dioxygenase-like cupin family protein
LVAYIRNNRRAAEMPNRYEEKTRMKKMRMKKTGLCLLLVILVAGCASPKHFDEVRSVQLIKSTEAWNGQPLPAYKSGQPEITIVIITIPPRYTLPMHTHPVINAGVLLKGQLTVTTQSGQTLHLKPYDAIVEVVDTWHYGKNEGHEPAEILVLYAGIMGEPITINKPENE